MDFSQTPEGTDAAGLAADILGTHVSSERHAELERSHGRFDHDLWRLVADAGLLALPWPEEYGGAGLGLLELCSVLVEIGRTVAPIPFATHAVTAMALARFGTPAQRLEWLPPASTGEVLLTTALSEDRLHASHEPVTRAENDGSTWLVTGAKAVVASGPLADVFLVPVQTGDGLTVLLVHTDDAGVIVQPQQLSGGEVVGQLELDRAVVPLDRVVGSIGEGAEVVDWLRAHLTVALCAEQLGVVEGALQLTSSYAKTREQFGRPIGTFQAVSQRLADGYIDVLGARLTMWQAAWRLSEGLPAEEAVAVAKLWAADAGHRLAHTTVHVHGGVGIDLDGEAHRYFTAAKRMEFVLGGTTEQSRALGRLLAGDPS